MKKIFLIAGLVMIVFVANAQHKWSLQQCVDTALANNRNIKQRELTKKTSEIAYNQARLNLLPDLNASISHNFSWGRALGDDNVYLNSTSLSQRSSFGISSRITLFDGLKMKYNIDAKMADLDATEANIEIIKREIVMSVSTAYLQVLLNKELLLVAENQKNLTVAKIEQQRKLVEQGKLAEGELLELQSQLSNEEKNIIQADNNLKLSKLDLAQVMEISDFDSFDIEVPQDLFIGELALLNANDIYSKAMNNRPEIKSAEYQLVSKEKNILIAESYFYPTLNLDASAGTAYYKAQEVVAPDFGQQISDKVGASVTFSLSIPIFNKFETRNQVRSSKIDLERSKLDLSNTKIELHKTIQQAYFNATAAKARWDAALKSEIASKEAYRFANQKFENGKATVYELYQAKSNLANAESEVVQAKYEYIFRLKILELLQ